MINLFEYQNKTSSIISKAKRNILLVGDMGIGKTVISIDSLVKSKINEALIICPASLKYNWKKEIENYTSDFVIEIIDGKTSYTNSTYISLLKNANIIIINYDILGVEDKESVQKEKERIEYCRQMGYKFRHKFIGTKGWSEILSQFDFDYIIVDECQYISNTKSIRGRSVKQICDNDVNAKKLFLSGTPFETKLTQFYNSLNILRPEDFNSEYNFKFKFCNPVLKRGFWTFDGVSNKEELQLLLDKFMIRIKKEDVLDLPDKQKIPIYIDLKNSIKKYSDKEEELVHGNYQHQFTCLAELKHILSEIKLKPTMQFIDDTLETNEKLVVFVYSKFMYSELMNKYGSVAVGINGETKSEARQTIVDTFQKNKKIKLFIGQIKASGVGITLTASNVVVFAEWGQTVAQMEQAVDRIHRIGQNKNCLIYYLICENTIDDVILERLNERSVGINTIINNTDDKMVNLDNAMIANVIKRRLPNGDSKISLEYKGTK